MVVIIVVVPIKQMSVGHQRVSAGGAAATLGEKRLLFQITNLSILTCPSPHFYMYAGAQFYSLRWEIHNNSENESNYKLILKRIQMQYFGY